MAAADVVSAAVRGGSSLVLVLKATTEANLSVVVLVLLGSFFAFKGVFDSKGVSDMGKLVYHVSLPCLLFSKILYEFSIERLHLLWILPFCCLLHVVSGYLVGEALGFGLCVNKLESRVGVAATMFGNVGSLAIAVVDSLCHSESLVEVTGSQQECSSIGISYIAFYLITQNILMFTWGENLMVHVDEDEEDAPGVKIEVADDDVEDEGEGGALSDRGSVVETEITEREFGGMRTRRRSLDRDADDWDKAGDKRDYLCRVSPYPTSLVRRIDQDPPLSADRPRSSSRRIEGPLTRRSAQALGYSIKLGTGGLRKVQSHLALECDHSLADMAQMGTSPTHKLKSTIEQYIHFLASNKEDLQQERRNLKTSLDQALDRAGGGGGSGPEDPLLGSEGEGRGGREDVTSPMKRAASFVSEQAVRVKSTYTVCMDRTLLVLYRLARTPALQASASAILLASIPSVKDLFVLKSRDTTKVPPLYFVYDAVSTLGSAQVPVSMIMLSGTATIRYMTSLRRKAITMTVKEQEERGDLSPLEGPGAPQAGGPADPAGFSTGAVVMILLGRTCIMPFVGLGWWWVLNHLKLIPSIEGHTPVMQLVILIESAVPTAQNVVMLLLVHGRMEKGEALAQIVLVQMAVSIITFTLACSFFQWLVIPM